MKVRVGLAYTGGLGAIHVDPADSTSDVVLAGGHVHLYGGLKTSAAGGCFYDHLVVHHVQLVLTTEVCDPLVWVNVLLEL